MNFTEQRTRRKTGGNTYIPGMATRPVSFNTDSKTVSKRLI